MSEILGAGLLFILSFAWGMWVKRRIERPRIEHDMQRFADLYRGETAADRAERDELAWRLGLLPYGVHQWITDADGNVVWNHDVDTQWRQRCAR